MPLDSLKKDQLHALIVAALAEHQAMHGRVTEIPAFLPISEEWHQLDPSRANGSIALPAGSSHSLTVAIGDVVAEHQRRYRLDLPPMGLTTQP
ncbi:hypothetical protein JY96_21215 [Aquabacterium sp. NJ1]|uniref:hypothetical protein n=1 Tax=Aquabacterium sp. NJ1 TaxID=1538295 RepID=UPI00052CE73B|nr:hypothetical protein [Aquabacterium sp. NJ1]KGM38698.1 hypothetical protein JY96_21215 [Aquabacterium sp. NJ1]